MEIEVLVPVAPVGIDESPLASRLADLGGRRIGFLDNQKANAGLLLDHVVDELRQRVGTFEVVREAKIATAGSPPAVMDHLRQCEAVVLAIAD